MTVERKWWECEFDGAVGYEGVSILGTVGDLLDKGTVTFKNDAKIVCEVGWCD